jgi:hypothetical protein
MQLCAGRSKHSWCMLWRTTICKAVNRQGPRAECAANSKQNQLRSNEQAAQQFCADDSQPLVVHCNGMLAYRMYVRNTVCEEPCMQKCKPTERTTNYFRVLSLRTLHMVGTKMLKSWPSATARAQMVSRASRRKSSLGPSST